MTGIRRKSCCWRGAFCSPALSLDEPCLIVASLLAGLPKETILGDSMSRIVTVVGVSGCFQRHDPLKRVRD